MSYNIYLDDRWQETSTGKVCSHTPHDIEVTEVKPTTYPGFYAYVSETGSEVTAGVDHVRSIPLFYAVNDGDLYLSNNDDWISRQLTQQEKTELIDLEYKLTGYVTGYETRHPEIKQLLPGESLHWENNKLSIRNDNKFEYSGGEKKNVEEAKKVAKATIQRLIEYANGRKIVIPLSGGLDSRLIAGLLVQQNYQNLLAVTYGRQNTAEVTIAEQRANALGIDWKHIEYNHKTWREWWESENRDHLYDLNDNLTVIPQIEMGPALTQLSDNSAISSNAVIVPGHSGDMIAGGHLPEKIYKSNNADTKNVVEMILKKHYSLDTIPPRMRPKLEQRVTDQLDISDPINTIQACEAYEAWDFRNRQAGFIINSMRTVEASDFDWYLPLWDQEFMDFWLSVPLKQRTNKKLYSKVVTDLWTEITEEDVQSATKTEHSVDNTEKSLLYYTKKAIQRSPAEPVLRPLYDRFVISHTHYNSHPLGWYGVVPKKAFRQEYTKDAHINKFLAKNILGDISINRDK